VRVPAVPRASPFGSFCDNQPEDELEGGGGASPGPANDHLLAPCTHGLERLA
jgi:hypothetical protein